MNLSLLEKQQQDHKMFGCPELSIHELVEHCSNIPMLVASILSDAQEALAEEDEASARVFMNRAKFIIFEYMDCRELNGLKRKRN